MEVFKVTEGKWRQIAEVTLGEPNFLVLNLKCARCVINLVVVAVFTAIISSCISKFIIGHITVC